MNNAKRNPLPPSGGWTSTLATASFVDVLRAGRHLFRAGMRTAVGASFEHVFAFQASVLRSLSASFLFSLSLRLCYTYRHIWAVRRPTESRNRPPSSSCAKPRLSALFHHKRDTMDYLEPARTTTEAACYDPKVQRSAPQCRHTPPVPTASTLN